MLPPTRTFRDRRHAGAAIGRALFPYVSHPEVIVLGLPRGGVPVAFEIAARLDVALDVLVVRKLGVPGHARVAMGAIASGGIRVFDAEIVEAAGVSSRAFEEVIDRETVELERLEQVWRGARPPAEVHGRTVILVDDGVATGATMLAAISALRTRKPAKIVVAIPVGAPTVCRALRAHVDELVCLVTPEPLPAISLWYEDFYQVGDPEVRELLDQAARTHPPGSGSGDVREPGPYHHHPTRTA
ncbi:MAG: phosphoribosyltransferase [Myxococcota bacterium]|nr:phosphoribosyltransferase [Myxococcota bacterium]